MVEGRILKALTGAKVDELEEVLTETSSGGVEDAEDAANGASTDKLVVGGGSTKNACPVLVRVIAAGGLIADGGV